MITFWQFLLLDDTLHMNTGTPPAYNHDLSTLAILWHCRLVGSLYTSKSFARLEFDSIS